MAEDTEAIKAALLKKTPHEGPPADEALLRTGSTLLDLAMTGRVAGGLAMGKYFWVVGDSSSGKTFLTLTCLAEAARSRRFADYRFIYDPTTEDGALMDFAKFFGPRMAGRVEMRPTTTIDQFFYAADSEFDKGPCIYILDSMDGLLGNKEAAKFKERKAAYGTAKAEKLKGDYGDGKAKLNSSYIRQVLAKARDTKSILIVISQTRDNFDEYGPDKVVSGGHALKFYSTCQLWSSRRGKIEKTYKDNELQIGINVRVEVKKNRLSGKEWEIEVPIYHTYGIDDIGSCVDYLIDWKHWSKPQGKQVVTAPDLDFEGTRERLIKKIEEDGLEKDLRAIVGEVWAGVEQACALKRKPRYE
jgi:RecA/RadA recombinase